MPDRINLLLEMLRNEPHDSFLNYALALEYAKQDEINKAVEIIEQVLLRDENYLGAYYQLGKYYEQLNQKAKAARTYQKGIEIAKRQKNTKALSELAEALGMMC